MPAGCRDCAAIATANIAAITPSTTDRVIITSYSASLTRFTPVISTRTMNEVARTTETARIHRARTSVFNIRRAGILTQGRTQSPILFDMSESRQHLSMIRSYTAADALTIGNASCGTIAIFLCLDYVATASPRYLWMAFILIPLALVCDVLDGYVARIAEERVSRCSAGIWIRSPM